MKRFNYSAYAVGALLGGMLFSASCSHTAKAPKEQYSNTFTKAQGVLPGDITGRYQSEVFSDFIKISNITYGENFNPTTGVYEPLKLRLFQPKGDTNTKRPLVIITPGGGFVKHGDDWMENFGERFARAGYVTAITRYRLSESIDTPELYFNALFKSFSDQKSAIRFFMHDAATANVYGVDTNNIFIGGHSAGAITSMHVAFLDATDTIPPVMRQAMEANGGITGNSGHPNYQTPIRGVINLSGGVTHTSIFKPNGTALLSIHGDKDDIVPIGINEVRQFYGSAPIHKAAKKAGVDSTFYPIAGLSHNGTVYDDECPSCIPTIMDFIYQHLDTTTLQKNTLNNAQ